MNLGQKTLLAKFLILISFLVLGIALLSAPCFANESNSNEGVSSSPFNILGNDTQKSDEEDLLIVKQPINRGDMDVFNDAKIRLLHYGTGVSTECLIKRGKANKCADNIYVSLRECKKDKEHTFNPVSMASISIKNNKNIVFEGWLFSQNSSVSSPKVEDYFFYLSECKS